MLNCYDFFETSINKVREFHKSVKYDPNNIELLLKRQMMDIDYNKLSILKDIIEKTNAKVVITSTWKKLKIYPYVQKELIKLGIPIIDVTIDDVVNRGTGIKKYLTDHKIEDYVILDDEIFKDYDEELLNRLVKTSFYDGGLQEKHKLELIKKLKM